MKRSRFTEEQIIAVLREQEAGVSTAEVCRKQGINTLNTVPRPRALAGPFRPVRATLACLSYCYNIDFVAIHFYRLTNPLSDEPMGKWGYIGD